MDLQNLVQQQFGNTARNYLSSTVHAQGTDLARLTALAKRLGPERVLDLGCGAGHASFAVAAGGARAVVAYDLSAEMLAVVATAATERGHSQIATLQGPVEALPFADGEFDLVVTRFSAHHWLDMGRALAEAARVLAPGGTLVVIDVVAPETPLYDTVLQTIELLRDASHVRDYRVSEWRAMLTAAGLDVQGSDSWKLPLAFDSWVVRIGTPPGRVAALRETFAALTREARDYFAVTADDSFSSDTAWIEARRAN
ncbi:methyltransferase domain-containing protein [Crenobacter sp. SG2303]|uniref:Methyltransferase domain-containing protein n=1 Tax=Crenobacter oryzisoli TaxID=3056844 RepID=A0ABT7XJQ9_9NEIS|nr:class I SAM-dependent methyltransferase [Crenobacter sp. SG2303]MDN0074008.1 methyltransferase domain-containing protein [Crenobacter sp. SG2303]